MHAWIVGATGLVGRALLDAALAEPRVERVTAVVRRPLERADPKLAALVVDFDRLEQELAEQNATHAFCCLGTTIKKAGSQTAFYRVDHDYPLAFARAALSAGVKKLAVVTAVGAHPKSSIFYNRVKGELERDLGALGLPELHVLRPSLLLGDREDRRPAERVGIALAKPLGKLMIGPLARYRAIEGADVAKAMLALALDAATHRAVTIHESDQLRRLAGRLDAGSAR
jgi:uncharacterized protein YbjT (DUF2867 family)